MQFSEEIWVQPKRKTSGVSKAISQGEENFSNCVHVHQWHTGLHDRDRHDELFHNFVQASHILCHLMA